VEKFPRFVPIQPGAGNLVPVFARDPLNRKANGTESLASA
jgi:hypothetical protein